MSATQASCLLYFDDEEAPALRLSQAAGLTALAIARHRFPDGELKLTLPVDAAGQLPARAVLLRSLDQPNEKLIELLLAARSARSLGVRQLTLVAPYLAYMRQDIAFHPGEAVSQRIVGPFLASLFDAVVTVDPHLHRIERLEQAIPVTQAVVLSGAGKHFSSGIDLMLLAQAGSPSGVDAVSGSTMTSKAVFEAMNDCLAQAALE